MSPLVFVRHSLPLINEALPARDWILSPDGVAAAEALARRLIQQHRIVAVASSTEAKAQGTAEIIARHADLRPSLDPDLCEHRRSTLGFLPRRDFEAGVESLLAHPGDLVFGDETADAVYKRFAAAVSRAATQADGATIIVTHGTALAIYLSRQADIDPWSLWRSLTMPMALWLDGGTLHTLRS